MEEQRVIDGRKSQIMNDFLLPLRDKSELLQRRRYPEKDLRPRVDGEFQRDYTRILYASSFRRLQDVYAYENEGNYMRSHLFISLTM